MNSLRSKLLSLVCILLPVSLFAQLPDPTAAGEYSFTTFDSTFTDNQFSNTDISARYYIPDAPGEAHPVLVFGHGFTVTYTAYENLYEHFASWGYVVAALDEQNGLNISHPEFAQQMLATITMLENESDNAASRFHQRISGQAAAMGHSMGGGSSLIAAVEGPQLVDAVVGLAPAETNPSVIDDMQDIEAELFIISSRGDSVTPENSVQIPMYNAATTSKLWISLLEGGHCAFTDASSTTCEIGATTVGDAGTLSYAEQQGLALKYSTAFLEYHLKGVSDWASYVCGTVAAEDTAVEHLTNYDCTALGRVSLRNEAVTIYPNPASNQVTIRGTELQPVAVDVLGRQFTLPRLNADAERGTYDVNHLSTGCYTLLAGRQVIGRLIIE